ncbi:alpha/beta fold hydrolase [Congregibacter variabilis]|uniref:Alpha/beta fold hydrolase n=1 Tax=Congregibacter variabilis TaxID=3081200 RepID=A0ABZ0I2H7_9GAMM|nr:alpha/beta fold hydrolase [Congregibacter sp. IMCC43200]
MRQSWILGLIVSLSALTALPAVSEEQNVSISNGMYSIPGILALPSSTQDLVPAVLLLHGTASQKNEVGNLYQHLAKVLADAGIASLRIDFAGAGDSPVDHGRYSLSGATRDAQASFDYLVEHPMLHSHKIIALGFSQGGLVAQRLALQEPGLLALATWSSVATDGAGSFADFFDDYYQQAVSAGYAQVSFEWLPEPLAFSLQWFQEIEAQQTLSEMRDFKKPILAIAGAADRTVPYQQSMDLISQSNHPMSQLVLLAGAGHVFNVLTPRENSPQKTSSHERLLSLSREWIVEVVR